MNDVIVAQTMLLAAPEFRPQQHVRPSFLGPIARQAIKPRWLIAEVLRNKLL
jgi:hypothetical protein